MRTDRGHVSIEFKRLGGDWLGVGRVRMWTRMLLEDAEYEDGSLDYLSYYQLYLLKVTLAVKVPAGIHTALIKTWRKLRRAGEGRG